MGTTNSLKFEIFARDADSAARLGRVTTPHGAFDTPAFMPVGTRGTVKGLLPGLVADTGSQIILNNTYHLMLRPGSEIVAALGGAHRFIGWDGPILTDSGGFQVFSLSDINKLDDDGVTFKSHWDGSLVRLTPERSMQVQNELGADIIMAFDDCPPAQSGNELSAGKTSAMPYSQRNRLAADRTRQWLGRCVKAHARDDQALFAIVQGGADLQLRSQCVEQVTQFNLPGYAIGGCAVGEGHETMMRVVEHTAAALPADKPRYLMGVGYPWDILAAVRAGVDMFDCVLPTRNGRNAQAFTPTQVLRLRNAQYQTDPQPIQSDCDCVCCAKFSRAYLRHLFLVGEMLGPILVSLHNIRYFQRLMLDIRGAVRENDWSLIREAWPIAQRAGRAVNY